MYKLVKSNFEGKEPSCVQRLLDGTFIPFDPNNTDYIKYLEWVAEGNEPLPADE